MSKASEKRQEKQNAIDQLKKIIKPGDRIYTMLRHVSRSGMMRHISVFIKDDDGINNITWAVARALEYKRADNGGLKIGGCGMDMGFSVVYELSHCLYSEGFTCIGEGCPSNDHFNGDRDCTPHKHNDGGYALKQSWL